MHEHAVAAKATAVNEHIFKYLPGWFQRYDRNYTPLPPPPHPAAYVLYISSLLADPTFEAYLKSSSPPSSHSAVLLAALVIYIHPTNPSCTGVIPFGSYTSWPKRISQT